MIAVRPANKAILFHNRQTTYENTAYTFDLPSWCISAVTHVSVSMLWKLEWQLWYQKLACQAGISNYIPQFTVGCNYLSLPEIFASGTKVLIYPALQNLHYSEVPLMPSLIKLAGCLIQPTCPWSPCRFELILYTSSHIEDRHSPWIIPAIQHNYFRLHIRHRNC